MLLFLEKNIFKDQPGGEPYRKIIEADKTRNIVGSFAVIPGTKGEKPQNTAADKFNEHDAGTVKTAAQKHRPVAQAHGKRSDDCCKSVDRKHPDGCVSV